MRKGCSKIEQPFSLICSSTLSYKSRGNGRRGKVNVYFFGTRFFFHNLPPNQYVMTAMKNYHVYIKGVHGWGLFYRMEDCLMFYTLFSTLAREMRLRIIAFCLMFNHIHFLVEGISQKEAIVCEDIAFLSFGRNRSSREYVSMETTVMFSRKPRSFMMMFCSLLSIM